ncbi:MAG: MBL fold metallo-hydrolase [Bacteroidales bacterium]|nr:MBL fold metallo-hydrolase [Bacteroidales bacterium]
MLQIKTFIFNPFEERGMVLWDESLQAVIVDPGCYTDAELGIVRRFIGENHLEVKAIWLTHAHFDHIYGVSALASEYKVPVYMNPEDEVILSHDALLASNFGLRAPDISFKRMPAKDGDVLHVGASEFKVIETPGHSPGCICFWNEAESILISGDTLFAGSIGRTDSPWGDYDKLIVGIMDKLMGLPGETLVIPGHGPRTDIAYERTHNPFLQPFNEPGGDDLDWDDEGVELKGLD